MERQTRKRKNYKRQEKSWIQTNMKIFIIRLKLKWAYYVTKDMERWHELYDLLIKLR